SCIAGKRFIVHEDIYDRFAEAFAKAMGALRVGDPSDEQTEVGPLASASAVEELTALVDDALAQGAVALTGGKALDGPGWFFPPTVITGITPAMRLYHEEAFGPVASLYRVSDIDEAIALANATDFGLSSAAWTNDPDEQQRLVRGIEAG